MPQTANTLTRRMHKGINTTCDEGQTLIPMPGGGFDDLGTTHTLRGEGFDASEDGTGRGTPLVPVAYSIQERAVSENLKQGPQGKGYQEGVAYTLEARNKVQAVAFAENQRGEVRTSEVVNLTVGGGKPGQGYPAIAFPAKDYGADAMEDCSPTLRAGGHDGSHQNGGVMPAVAFSIMPMNSGKDYKARQTDVAQPIMAGGPVGGNQGGDFIKQASAVRRLTPRECERLQGFPDDFTMIPWRSKPAEQCPDGPRYRALGNSMAIPVVRWLGERIQQVEEMTNGRCS